MLLADIICQNITSEKTFQEVLLLISCLSCINRAVSRRASTGQRDTLGNAFCMNAGCRGVFSLASLPPPPLASPCHACNHTRLGPLPGKQSAFQLTSGGAASHHSDVFTHTHTHHTTAPWTDPPARYNSCFYNPGCMTSQAHWSMLGGSLSFEWDRPHPPWARARQKVKVS